jgi:uncharacterized protein (UPF0305 family)
MLTWGMITKNRLAEIASIADQDIDCSDIPEADEEFFKKAKFVRPRPQHQYVERFLLLCIVLAVLMLLYALAKTTSLALS